MNCLLWFLFQCMLCSVLLGMRFIVCYIWLVISVFMVIFLLVLLKCGKVCFLCSMWELLCEVIGGCLVELRMFLVRFDVGIRFFRFCWYWMLIVLRLKLLVMWSVVMYIFSCYCICLWVSFVVVFFLYWNVIFCLMSQLYVVLVFFLVMFSILVQRVDCDRCFLQMLVLFRSLLLKIVLYMFMQFLLKMLMMVFFDFSFVVSVFLSCFFGLFGSVGSGCICEVLWVMELVLVYLWMLLWNQLLVKLIDQIVVYGLFIFVRLVLRLSRFMSFGQLFVKFVIVRIGFLCVCRFVSMWCEYCQFVMVIISGVLIGMFWKILRFMCWFEMKLCLVLGLMLKGWMIFQLRVFSILLMLVFSLIWVGYFVMFVDLCRLLDVIRYVVFGVVVGWDVGVGRVQVFMVFLGLGLK